MDTTAMDIDPPFYQRGTDSSNEELAKYAVPSQSPAYRFVQGRSSGARPGMTHSSSADDCWCDDSVWPRDLLTIH